MQRQKRVQSRDELSFCWVEEDPRNKAKIRNERVRSGNRGVSLSTFEATDEQDGLEDRLSPKFEKLMLL